MATAFGRPDLAGNGALCRNRRVRGGSGVATWVVSRGMTTTAGLSNIGVGLGTIIPALSADRLHGCVVGGTTGRRPRRSPSAPWTPTVRRTLEHRAGRRHLRRLRRPGGGTPVTSSTSTARPASYFKAVMAAAGLVFVMYMLGSLAISVAVPNATLRAHLGVPLRPSRCTANGFGIPGLSNVLSGLLVLGAVAAWIAWIAGPSRSMWLVGRAGYLPQRLPADGNANDVQMPILFFQGVIVTILALVFVVAPNTSAAFTCRNGRAKLECGPRWADPTGARRPGDPPVMLPIAPAWCSASAARSLPAVCCTSPLPGTARRSAGDLVDRAVVARCWVARGLVAGESRGGDRSAGGAKG